MKKLYHFIESDKVLLTMTNAIEKIIKNFYIARFFYHLKSNSFQRTYILKKLN